MRSSTKWIFEIVVVALILLVLSQLITWGFSHVAKGGHLTTLEQILITIYLLLVGLVAEVVRWARESVEQARDTVRNVLDDALTASAERAVRSAVLRSIFPSGNPDPVNARIHFGIVEDYLTQVESQPLLVQRASG